MKEDVFICACSSLEHQMHVWHDEEDKEVSFHVHLYTHKNFFKRVWSAIRYVFGYKSRYGNWDVFIMREEEKVMLQHILTDEKADKLLSEAAILIANKNSEDVDRIAWRSRYSNYKDE